MIRDAFMAWLNFQKGVLTFLVLLACGIIVMLAMIGPLLIGLHFLIKAFK